MITLQIGKHAAFAVLLFLMAAMPESGLAADELGNIAQPVVPGVEAPAAPSVPEPQVTEPPVPEAAAPDAVLVPVPPAPAEAPGAVTVPQFNATLPASNGTLPFANGTFPLYNATIPAANGTLPASNATLPGRVLVPFNNATRPADNATLPGRNGTVPVAVPTGPLTPADFLPKTAEKPETAVAQAQPKKPQKPPRPEEKKEPEKKPAPQPVSPKAPAKGEPMQIPEEAKKSGSLDFLKGCWVGRRPEYNSKRMITERFCFDEHGVGKRTISDPGYAGQCVGAARAVMNQGGVLRIISERSYCTSGDEWGQADMTCRGEGSNTPCSWMFKDINSSARQAYTITFVRD